MLLYEITLLRMGNLPVSLEFTLVKSFFLVEEPFNQVKRPAFKDNLGFFSSGVTKGGNGNAGFIIFTAFGLMISFT
jgi:hypothetical protein